MAIRCNCRCIPSAIFTMSDSGRNPDILFRGISRPIPGHRRTRCLEDMSNFQRLVELSVLWSQLIAHCGHKCEFCDTKRVISCLCLLSCALVFESVLSHRRAIAEPMHDSFADLLIFRFTSVLQNWNHIKFFAFCIQCLLNYWQIARIFVHFNGNDIFVCNST